MLFIKEPLELYAQLLVTIRWVSWQYSPKNPQGKALFPKSDNISLVTQKNDI